MESPRPLYINGLGDSVMENIDLMKNISNHFPLILALVFYFNYSIPDN